ncbi:hypothetical protein [Neobacillus sp. PS3-40]|uniref:hypothetical protein n=1 Tax=Neobacillus sp. PS3-40 TaxID=3070679 RepID=UPI0027DEE12B|nr:hypothetical protein [Neobacillus sp. PS3-40]WML43136.1 hypothetical protein RCG20_15175 [Neobacillus sp. PS3-40]
MRKRRKWNEEKIKEVLLNLYHEGKLTISYLYMQYGGMVRAIVEDYGSLEVVFGKLGIPFEDIYKLEHWPAERVLQDLISLHKQGVLTPIYLRENHLKLLYGCKARFGSLENALKECGISYEEIRLNNIWTKDKVDSSLLELDSQGVLTPIYVRNHGDGLLGGCKRFYGSLENAVEANGISYQDILQRESWDKQKVTVILRDMNNEGHSLQSLHLKINYPEIHAACVRLFGSFINAITSAGFTIDEIYGTERWDKKKILLNLQELGVEGILKTKNFALEFRPLYKACYREFGSFINACEAAGLPSRRIKESRPYMDKKTWEADEVINNLYEWFYVKGKTQRELFTENSKLEKAARDHFGTLRKALNEIDVDYEQRWRKNVRSAGIRFENIVEKVLGELNYPIVLRNKLINVKGTLIKPDFVLEGNIYIDAKISAWTQSIEDTINKYKDYCKELWIVYWYSERKSFDGVQFKSIEEFIEMLPEEKKYFYHEELNDLEVWLNESVINKRE